MTKCIYCGNKENAFPTEHVIPKTLGLFGPDTYILQNVCGDCNSYFDRTFEEPVFRKSVFALFKHELFTKEHPHLKSKVKYRYIESSEYMKISLVTKDVWNGALLAINIDNKTLEIVSQIGFKIKDGKEEYEFITFKTLQKDKSILKSRIEAAKKLKDKNIIFIYGRDKTTEQKIFRFLYKNGLKIENKNMEYGLTPKSGQQLTELILILNDVVKRAMAKIAFNFFAYYIENGNQLPRDHIYKDYYDSIRNYIRFGIKPQKNEYVSVNTKPILFGEKRMSGSRIVANIKAHIVTLTSNGNEVVAKVCLFYPLGVFVFSVHLGLPKPVVLSMHEAKAFDYENKKIISMISRQIFDRAGLLIIGK